MAQPSIRPNRLLHDPRYAALIAAARSMLDMPAHHVAPQVHRNLQRVRSLVSTTGKPVKA